MRTLLLLSCLALAGCESAADVISKHRAGVEKTLSALRALQPKVAAAEPVTEAKVKAVPVVIEGSAPNAMFVYADDLKKPGEAASVRLRTLDSVTLLHCGSLLNTQHFFDDAITRVAPSVAEQYLTNCEKLQYALVIREVEFVPPKLSLETRKFKPALYRAEVLVFEVKTGELLGGFPLIATNEASVMLLDGDADHLKRLLTNLESTVFNALREGARQAFPGSLPPPKK